MFKLFFRLKQASRQMFRLVLLLLIITISALESLRTDKLMDSIHQFCKTTVDDTCECKKGIKYDNITSSYNYEYIKHPSKNVLFNYVCLIGANNKNNYLIDIKGSNDDNDYFYIKSNNIYNITYLLGLFLHINTEPNHLVLEKCLISFNDFAYFQNLNTLDLQYCHFSDLSNTQASFDNLNILFIQEPKPVQVINTLLDYKMPNMIYLTLKNVILRNYSFSKFSSMLFLDIHKSDLNKLDDNTFKVLPLVNLCITDSQIQYIHKDSFSGLKYLTSISLQGNQFSTIPSELFKNNKLLLNVILSNNLIQSIPEYLFSNLANLKFLDLSNMKLASIDKNTFNGLSNLSVLNLSNNSLTNVTKDVFLSFVKLETLDLRNNQIEETFLVPHNVKRLYLDHNQRKFVSNNLSLSIIEIITNPSDSIPETQTTITSIIHDEDDKSSIVETNSQPEKQTLITFITHDEVDKDSTVETSSLPERQTTITSMHDDNKDLIIETSLLPLLSFLIPSFVSFLLLISIATVIYCVYNNRKLRILKDRIKNETIEEDCNRADVERHELPNIHINNPPTRDDEHHYETIEDNYSAYDLFIETNSPFWHENNEQSLNRTTDYNSDIYETVE